jgi:hypothetical protein
MGAIEEGGKVASGIVDGLKHQPLALALVIINALFLGSVGYVLHRVGEINSAAAIRRDELLADLARNCVVPPPAGSTRESIAPK